MGTRGLYIHIPFCSVKCHYCDFTAFSGQGSFSRRYLKSLKMETLARWAGYPDLWPTADSSEERRPPRPLAHTLYVGGGTPSELAADELTEVLRIAESVLGPLEDLAESTFEANPESLTDEKLRVLADWGVSRLSLGLQTMEPRLLSHIGRRHSPEDFTRVFRNARALGFSIGVDLMYGLPTQSREEALRSLEAVLALYPEHLSLYGLQVEDRTLFGKREVEVDEDLSRDIYETSIDRLAAAGYRHYEVSNFARPGRESLHNQIYWRNGEYLGLGCGASGCVGGVRYSNLDRLEAYCSAVEKGVEPTASRETLVGRERLAETILLGLRMLDGIALTPEMLGAFSEEWRHLQELGWVRFADGRARLTREGVFLANRVFEEFVPPFRGASATEASTAASEEVVARKRRATTGEGSGVRG